MDRDNNHPPQIQILPDRLTAPEREDKILELVKESLRQPCDVLIITSRPLESLHRMLGPSNVVFETHIDTVWWMDATHRIHHMLASTLKLRNYKSTHFIVELPETIIESFLTNTIFEVETPRLTLFYGSQIEE